MMSGIPSGRRGWKFGTTILGSGSARRSLTTIFRQHRPAKVQTDPMRTHNDYLNTLVDWGWSGRPWWRRRG